MTLLFGRQRQLSQNVPKASFNLVLKVLNITISFFLCEDRSNNGFAVNSPKC